MNLRLGPVSPANLGTHEIAEGVYRVSAHAGMASPSLSPLPGLVEATGLVTHGLRRGLAICCPGQGLPSSFSRNGGESRFALAVTACVAYSSGIHLKVTVQTSLSPGGAKDS